MVDATEKTAAAVGWWSRFGALGGRTIAMLLLLVLIVAAADKSRAVYDASADKRFSLSPKLIELLRAQNEPVTLWTFWPKSVDEPLAPITAVLEAATRAQHTVTLKRIDPETNRPELDRFVSDFNETPVIPGLYITRGARAFRLPLAREVLQRELGGALISLADPHPPSVLVLQGHGELRPGGGETDGADVMLRNLAVSGYRVQTIDAGFTGALPADAVVVVPGPTSPLGTAHCELLAQHLRDGGGLLVLADDRLPADLGALLRRRGVITGANKPKAFDGAAAELLAADAPLAPATAVFSISRHFRGQEQIAYHNLLLDPGMLEPAHPITALAAAGGVQVLSPWTTAILVPLVDDELAKAFVAAGTPPFVPTILMRTAPADAWSQPRGRLPQAPADLSQQKPIPLAAALEYQAATGSVRAGVGARVVVWGSRQAASDGVLAQGNFANATVLIDAVHWLARRTPPADIPAAETAVFQVQASDRTMTLLMALLCAVIPCLFIGVAILTWWDRR